jgi:circadian clock protein KaiC
MIKKIEKIPTGLPGLDEVLHGGLPVGRTTMISGGPGAGKTILALQVLHARAIAGEPSVFVACEERTEILRENALSMGLDLGALEEKGLLAMIPAELDPAMAIAGAVDLKGLLAIIEAQMKAIGAKNVVIDGIDVLLRVLDDQRKERNELHAIHQVLQRMSVTAILTAKMANAPQYVQHEWLEFMADCVILLDHRVDSQISTRRLRVLKYRGSPTGRNEYPYVIGGGGLRMIPISSSHLLFKAARDRSSTGNAALDGLIGGGIMKGTSVMICGASGVGKTTLAATIAAAACERKERTLYISFEESQDALLNHLMSPGIHLHTALRNDILRIHSAFPESTGAEEHMLSVLDQMDQFQPQHIIVDPITAAQRMGSSLAAFDYAMRLLSSCRERNVTCIFTNQLKGQEDEGTISGLGLSSLVDTIIFLKNRRIGHRMERFIGVVKSRGTAHTEFEHKFRITPAGIQISPLPLPGDEDGASTRADQSRTGSDRTASKNDLP